MVAAAAETAPASMEEMHVSEGWRHIPYRVRDLHEELRAWDISARGMPNDCVAGSEKRILRLAMDRWAERIQKKLGPAYTVVVHDTGSGLHIHIELDP